MKPLSAEEEHARQLLAASLELQQELLPIHAAAQALDYIAGYMAEQTSDGTVDPHTPIFQHHPIARLLLNSAQGLTEDGKPYAGRYRYDVAFDVSGYYITRITFTLAGEVLNPSSNTTPARRRWISSSDSCPVTRAR